ncbi:agamous-like mads-box protein agl62 [Phtheirospermum japonicum]|uniref:Agamous-like mads-box protein agl62 n=1 Tax=Phtheirospermum japonicum TaxID=374723 RepID=A0A830BXV8_9LAMI|nr:agamous-like mads-box protein agl62 [Phtheirospermum japonicum]
MVKMSNESNLQVTFSKRRSGLFKKASELCTLCGVEIAIIVFSPAGKVFSFGHPNVESIVDRLLARNPAQNTNDPFHLVEAQRNASVRELNLQLGQILNELEMERKRGESLDNMRKTNQSHYWWEGPVEKLGLDELEQLKDAMEELKKNVGQQATKMINPAPMFVSNGVFDQYETKPSQPIMGPSSANTNFGYCHGFF